MGHLGERPNRMAALLYDQQLRLLASHFSNMHDGRAHSASHVSRFFHELVGILRPTLFVEAGAYRAEASRAVREALPDSRVVAFEANPHNHREFADALGFGRLGIDYLNVALTDHVGPVTFNLRTRDDGENLRPITGNSSLLLRDDDTTEYEAVTVDGTTLDTHFPSGDPEERAALWIDVEGASGLVLSGARELVARTDLVLVEVEERPLWQHQWNSLDVLEFFLDAGLVPLSRDIEYPQQHNVVLVSEACYRRPEVLLAHELHTNYLTQHMGVRPPAV